MPRLKRKRVKSYLLNSVSIFNNRHCHKTALTKSACRFKFLIRWHEEEALRGAKLRKELELQTRALVGDIRFINH